MIGTGKRIYDKQFWWESKKDIYLRMLAKFDALRESAKDRDQEALLNMRLYGNVYMRDLSLHGYAKVSSHRKSHRVQMNICQSMVDTVTAKVTSSYPKVQFLTDGGSFKAQQKAKRLTKFCSGMFYKTNLYKVAPMVFRDAAVMGMGIMKIHGDENGLYCERVFPNEVIIDEVEAINGEPRQFFQRKYISAEVLKRMFPNSASAIDDAPRVEGDTTSSTQSDMVECIEAWHLPSGKGANDGMHAICIDGADLLSEGYDRQRSPFVFMRWTPRLLGFFAEGLCSQLTGLQVELNFLCKQISTQMRLATPKVFLETGSQISRGTITNETWGIVEYTGTPPMFNTPQTTSPEVMSHLDRIFARAYEIAGISTLESQARKPAGLESGVALREYATQASTRFASIQRQYETMFLDAADHMIECVRDLSDADVDLEMIAAGDKDIEKIKWSQIDLDADCYVMKKYPVNLLPDTPAGKLQSVVEMTQAGLINPQQSMLLLDYPDTEALTQLATSNYQDVLYVISEILEHGKFIPPEPFQDLQLAIKMVNSAYLRAKGQGAPDDRLDLLRRYLESAVDLVQQAQHAEQAQAMAMQGMEPGQVDVGGPPQGGSMPATPGVSEELLNAGGGAEVPPQAPMQ